MRVKIQGVKLIALIAAFVLFAGCSAEMSSTSPGVLENSPVSSGETDVPVSTTPMESMEMIPLTESPAMFIMPMPAATGADVLGNEKAEIDISNKQDGYIMIKYLAVTDKKIAVHITGTSRNTYQYFLNNSGNYDVFPLSDGNGEYEIKVMEVISSDRGTLACSASFSVELVDEFAPFLRPNQYVNYNENSNAVKKAAELTKNSGGVLEKVGAVYDFVIKNISYDKELAEKITAKVVTGYLPDIDAVLESGKGICFDYAALMTAMLRSQGIPTKLVTGYVGTVFHAWINTYSEETGWVDAVIYFDGAGWKLMDPTFASTGGQNSDVMQYIGDGSNYAVKYLY